MRNHPGRCGGPAYANLLRLIWDYPGTTADLALRFGMGQARMRKVLRCLRDEGLIVERAWRRCVGGAWHQAVWSLSGPPAPRPATVPMIRSDGTQTDLIAFCALVRSLYTEASSIDQLVEAAGVALRTVRRVVARLLQLGLVFIKSWRRQLTPGGMPTPMYCWGVDRRNQARPQPLPPSATSAKHRATATARHQFAQLLFMTAGRSWPSSRLIPQESTSEQDHQSQSK